jgi:transporter family-2 protein
MGELIGVFMLALLGGISLGINRSLLGRLGVGVGAAGASVINHIGGALFVFFLLLLTGGRLDWGLFHEAPGYAYVGGVIGALFVMITSWLIPRAGVMKTTVLLISGQMLFGTILDFLLGRLSSFPVSLGGLSLILVGVLVGEYRKGRD